MNVFNDFSTPNMPQISVNYFYVENNYFIVTLCYLYSINSPADVEMVVRFLDPRMRM